jgi:hypothetical protein
VPADPYSDARSVQPGIVEAANQERPDSQGIARITILARQIRCLPILTPTLEENETLLRLLNEITGRHLEFIILPEESASQEWTEIQ